jgi:hypothetical protein
MIAMGRDQKMKPIALFILLFAAGCAWGAETPEAVAKQLDAQSRAKLGVGLRSLSFLFEASSNSYLLKESLVQNGSWPQIQQLEKAGFVTADVVRGLPNGQELATEFVTLRLTPKGQQVLCVLLEP